MNELQKFIKKKKQERLKASDPLAYIDTVLNELFDLLENTLNHVNIKHDEVIDIAKSYKEELTDSLEQKKQEISESLDEKSNYLLGLVIQKATEWMEANKPLDGKDGRDGRDGRDGAKGERGYTGEKGTDGKDGKDGKDASVDNLLPEQLAEKIDTTKNSLGIYVIRGLQEELEKIKRTIRSKGQIHGGGSTNSSSSGIIVEIPTGLVNSINTVFSVTAEPKYIVTESGTIFDGAGYTYSSLQVTLDVAPSQYIRAIK